MKRRNQGFTLAETLVTVVLIGVVFLAVSVGLPVVVKAYDEVTSKANAQTMMSTAIMEISADLKGVTTYEVSTDENGNQNTYIYSLQRGYSYQYCNDDTQGIVLKAKSSDISDTPLLTSKTNTNGMRTYLESFNFDSSTNLFTFVISIKKQDKDLLSQRIEIKPNNEVNIQQ